MYENILYPTDGSDGAKRALEDVRNLASTYGATVHVLYVAEQLHPHGLAGDVEVSSRGGMVGDPEGDTSAMTGDRTDDSELAEQVQAEATALVESVADQLDGLETQTAVRVGTPYQVILEYAGEQGIDMVVMGTHGRTGIDHYLLGSVTEKVVRTADVPVLTVGGDELG